MGKPVFARAQIAFWYPPIPGAWRQIPAEVRPAKDQPFYHLFAENADTQYVAYVSEQNLLPDESGEPVRSNPQIDEMFVRGEDGAYRRRAAQRTS